MFSDVSDVIVVCSRLAEYIVHAANIDKSSSINCIVAAETASLDALLWKYVDDTAVSGIIPK